MSRYIILSGIFREDGVTGQGKSTNKHKIWKWSQKDYIIQEKDHVEHNGVKITRGFNILCI